MIRLALPTGDLREPVGRLLASAGLAVDDYARGSRSYLGRLKGAADVLVRVFREKDIPIQIALGNYDLGICRLEWIEDLTQRYPTDGIVPLRDLEIGGRSLYVAVDAARDGDIRDWAQLAGLRIVSEYANIAEALAMGLRLSDYRVFPVWGSAEAYPPEDADLALVAATNEDDVRRLGLAPLHQLLESSVWLIANRRSESNSHLAPLLDSLATLGRAPNGRRSLSLPVAPTGSQRLIDRRPNPGEVVRMALPDGHQQEHAVATLDAAGLKVDGYAAGECVARPKADIPGLALKVIRPQDMPQQVALGHFDLAISGRDWLFDHLCAFPDSPVEEAVDLGLGRYRVAADVSRGLPVDSLDDAVSLWGREGKQTVRLASEYANVADHCARSHHLPRYKVIPISGASEGFVPEDAELLIEGTETGATLAANNLKAIDTLLESTACVIVRRGRVLDNKRPLLEHLLTLFRAAGAVAQAAEEA
jgi:ATP phosphoribosyltransferase